MLVLKRMMGGALAALLAAAPAAAQQAAGDGAAPGVPAGLYRFVPEHSDPIEDAIDRAVSHMNFLVRGIARGRLRGANQPIEWVRVAYPGDTVWVSLRSNEPPIQSPRDGAFVDYRRADGEVVQVRTELSPGVIEQYFDSEDGDKRMVYRVRPDGMLALEVEVLSEKLREPFTYTWVYRPVAEP